MTGPEDEKIRQKTGVRRLFLHKSFLMPSKLIKKDNILPAIPGEKWDRVSRNYHTRRQSRQEANQAMLNKGTQDISRVSDNSRLVMEKVKSQELKP